MQEQPAKVEVGVDLINAVLNYLVEQPYKDTAPLINALSQLQPAQAETPKKASK